MKSISIKNFCSFKVIGEIELWLFMILLGNNSVGKSMFFWFFLFFR